MTTRYGRRLVPGLLGAVLALLLAAGLYAAKHLVDRVAPNAATLKHPASQSDWPG